MRKKRILTILLICTSVAGNGQVQNRFNGWLSTINSFQLTKRIGFQFDFSLRSADQWQNVQTIIVRPGISYRLNKAITASIGYSNNRNQINIDEVNGYISEHQVWQQLFIRHLLFNKLTTLHRPLLEERFISNTVVENNSIKTSGRSFALRFRYSFRNVLPFKNQETFSRGPYAYAQQEILLIIANNTAINGKTYDQFRAVTGLGFRFSPKWDLESGYLFRDLATKTSAHFHDHIIQVSSFLRL